MGDLLLVDCSEPGQTIATLTNNFFPRIETAFQLIAEAAARKGTPVRHVATLFVQWSEDYGKYTNVNGECLNPTPPPPPPPKPGKPPNVCTPTTPTTDYINSLRQLFNRIDATARVKFGAEQTLPAVGIIMQTSGLGITGGRYSVRISEAQHRFARETTRNYPILQQVGPSTASILRTTGRASRRCRRRAARRTCCSATRATSPSRRCRSRLAAGSARPIAGGTC